MASRVFPFANTLQPYFVGYQPWDKLDKVMIRQRYANHTVTYLDFYLQNRRRYSLPKENAPYALRWGQVPQGVLSHFGYVNHYESVEEADIPYTRLVGVGTSKVMNTVVPTVWNDEITRSGIARDIAKRYRLRSIIHNHPHPMETWTSGLNTDYKVLQMLSDEAGYQFWVDGSTLYFVDPKKILYSAQSPNPVWLKQGQLLNVSDVGGHGAPKDTKAAKRRVIFGLDQGNNLFRSEQGLSSLPTEVSSDIVHTYADANALAGAVDRQLSEYQTIKVESTGVSGIYPGRLIYLDSPTLTKNQQGIWLVVEAIHHLNHRDYWTYTTAVRGSEGVPNYQQRSTIRGMKQNEDSVIRNGTAWEAKIQEHLNA